jgi:hypothetical protein
LCDPCYAAYRRGALVHPSPSSFVAQTEAVADRHDFTPRPGRHRAEYDAWDRVRDVVAPTPSISGRFVVRPEFCTGAGSFIGSYGFVVSVDGAPPLAVTALHVLDQLARTLHVDCATGSGAYTGHELPRTIQHVHLYDVTAPNWMGGRIATAGPMLVLPDARTGEPEPACQRDIAALVLGEGAEWTPRRLAGARPSVGSPIWLIANAAGAPRSLRAFAATVVESTSDTLIFRYAEGVALSRHTSGAPLLDRHGCVVGINIGGGTLNRRDYGHAHHSDNMRRHLTGAVPFCRQQ